MGALRTSYPRFRREGDAPPIELTEDDAAILRHVYRHRFIRADDIFRLFPERSQDKLSRRLMRLYRAGYLDRPIAQIDRFHQGGSQPLVYGLDTAGARYLKEHEGVSVNSADWKARNRTCGREHLDHALAITKFMIDLELACMKRNGVQFIPFEEILGAAPELTRRLAQPGRWSLEIAWNGSKAEVTIIPDAIFGIRTPGSDGKSIRTFIFLELDRGTMTVLPAERVRESEGFIFRASLARKFVAFGESHRRQLHHRHLGLAAARVLTVTTTPARARAIQKMVERLVVKPMGLPPGLFLFGVHQNDADPLTPMLFKGNGDAAELLPISNETA